MDKRLLLIAFLTAAACSAPQQGRKAAAEVDGVPVRELWCETLPSLGVPRAGHVTMLAGGELTVFGGHTTGFIPVQSAEYYKDGRWREAASMHYAHDNATAVQLEDGIVMLAGGSAEPFGIGRTFGAEVYSPETHAFTPLGILDRRRTFASAVTLPEGRVLVSGNWYAPDAVEMYSPDKGFTALKDVSEHRSCPFILPLSNGNVLIFSGRGVNGEDIPGIVDRLEGEPFRPEVLQEWQPFTELMNFVEEDFRIGVDIWLIPARNRADSTAALLRVSGEEFSLLPLEHPLPVHSPEGSPLHYGGILLSDRENRCVWHNAYGDDGRLYFLQINYDATLVGGKAQLVLYRTQEPGGIPFSQPILLPGGRIAITGGIRDSNFEPSAAVAILHTQPLNKARAALWWTLASALLLCLAAAAIVLRKRTKPAAATESAQPRNESTLAARIREQMEGEQLFRRKGLTKADLAAVLGTNVTYISACINTQFGKSFPDFIAEYRIRHAQQLMKRHRGMNLADVADESGFANEQSFFRSFKAATGLTPQEWKMRNNL